MTEETKIISVSELHDNFVNGFEGVWQVTKVGSIRCDRETRPMVEKWFNTYRLMIMLMTGVDMPELHFEEPTDVNDPRTSQNRVKMMEYYSISFTAYMKYCQMVKREMDAKFTDAKKCVAEQGVD